MKNRYNTRKKFDFVTAGVIAIILLSIIGIIYIIFGKNPDILYNRDIAETSNDINIVKAVSLADTPEVIYIKSTEDKLKEQSEQLTNNISKDMDDVFSKIDADRENQKKLEEENRKKLEKEYAVKVASAQPKKVSQINRGGRRSYHNLDLTRVTHYSSYVFRQMLSGTKLEQISDALVYCEEQYGVNGVFLASLAALESGYGESSMARNKNNITGFQAYDSATHMARRFTSYSDCIIYTAEYLSKHYLNENGKYYSGKTLSDVNKRYSSSGEWANKISRIMVNMQNVK